MRHSLPALLATLLLLAACGDGGGPAPVVKTTELWNRWEDFPHRISFLEIAYAPGEDARGGMVVGENGGGSFGDLDTAHAIQRFAVHRSDALRAVATSVEVEVPPAGGTDPEAFVASATARADDASLEGAETMVAWIRGYRVSTDEYASPPSFESDPELPYDPTDGFTTQGFGIQLGAPVREAGEISVPVTVRNSLGPADRGDMNAAIPEAKSWVRVDVLVVGVVDAPAATARSEVSYTLSTAEYGRDTEHPHASEAMQQLAVDGEPGLESGLVGLSGFDLWVNAEGHIDPSCEVVQDEINSWDEPISGPGRYVTELGTRLWDASYDAGAGRATAKLDLYFSNTSMLKEVGNVCLGARGELSLLQLDADVQTARPEPIDLTLRGGSRTTREVRFDG